jgi:hypothetical protein
MSEKKSITIDSSSLMGGGDTTKKKTSRRKSVGSGEHRIRPSSIVQPSTLKKTLLERIKQHQRTRERSRDSSTASDAVVSGDAGSQSTPASVEPAGDNFSQSIDFLRKLAMKRRQQTQKRHTSSPSSLPEAKTPEAQMLNKVAETLHHGEILTNTGLLGLPVVPTLVQPAAATSATTATTMATVPFYTMTLPNVEYGLSSIPAVSEPPPTPKLTELADMYNNTIAAASTAVSLTDAITSASAVANSSDTTIDNNATTEPYVPTKIEDFMPSIFIKEEPPHGCLKNGKKPTFREWASKLFGGGGGQDTVSNEPVSTVQSVSGGGSKTTHVDDVRDITGMRVKIRKTHKKRFRIGKHDNVVGVLLKNKQTQRHIQSQHLTLKQKTIGEIRKYLYDHHLLKIGSNAPPDVLRRMYEDSILTGDVKNTNDGVMLHNFMSGGGGE